MKLQTVIRILTLFPAISAVSGQNIVIEGIIEDAPEFEDQVQISTITVAEMKEPAVVLTDLMTVATTGFVTRTRTGPPVSKASSTVTISQQGNSFGDTEDSSTLTLAMTANGPVARSVGATTLTQRAPATTTATATDSILPAPTGTNLQTINSISSTDLVNWEYLARLCFDLYVPTAFCPNPQGLNTAAVWKSGADGKVFIDNARKWIIVVFRGTRPWNLQGKAANADDSLVAYDISGSEGCIDCYVHRGFQDTVRQNIAEIIRDIESILHTFPTYQLVITGHSRGAATAVLAGAALSQRFGASRTTLITFGGPRVGNAQFADYINSVFPLGNFYRVTSENDGVAQRPSLEQGYRHAGNEYWITKEPHPTLDDIRICNGSEDASCNYSVGVDAPVHNNSGDNDAHRVYFVPVYEEVARCIKSSLVGARAVKVQQL